MSRSYRLTDFNTMTDEVVLCVDLPTSSVAAIERIIGAPLDGEAALGDRLLGAPQIEQFEAVLNRQLDQKDTQYFIEPNDGWAACE